MPSGQQDLPGASELLSAVRNRAGSIRDKYVRDPVALAEKLGLLLPEKPAVLMNRLGVYDPERHGSLTPGLRELVRDVCLGTVRSAVAVANRGGGKSQGVSFIEFFLVFMKDYDALNLGGSELQADQVYQYILSYIESDKQFQAMVQGDPIASKTTTKVGAWIRVLTASQKSVRSPHAGGKKKGGRVAGGLLVIDEEAEAAPEIVAAALPTINTAQPSVNVRCSTFHNAEGSFAEVVDNAEEMGYEIYKWDIFDVAQKCSCTDGCQSEEMCFREDHMEIYIDPDTGQPAERLLHRAYCGGRAMYARGWIPMEEIVTLWKRMKRTHSIWEVEAMGSRPSSKGYVIRDLQTFFRLGKTDKTGAECYMPGWPVTVCVDWGARAAGVEVWQEQPGDHHALLMAEEMVEAGVSQIIGTIMTLVNKYAADFKEVAADIGGGGNYLNPKLREEHRIQVRDVNFAEEKEAAVAALNVFSEANGLILPAEFTDFHDQIRKWKRVAGRIQKGDDHLCDAAVCYFAQFIERLGLTRVRIPPRSIHSTPYIPGESSPRVTGTIATSRAPVFRSFSGRKDKPVRAVGRARRR